MSTSLYWEPVIEREGEDLSDALKFIFRKKYDADVIIRELYLNESDLEFLEGLCVAEVEDADKIITAIKKYGSIKLYEE